VFKLNPKTDTDNESEYMIEVNNVSKHFKIPHEKRTTVYDNIIGKITGSSYSYEVFEALTDVSFKIKKGETFGIIGENGSGKSTLLKILAGVLVPDSGSVKVRGKVAPFLELGVGFQPELTAVENVYLYGAIMGMKRKEMDAKLDSVFEFAELERFRDAKLKNFSSGMYARLAFATAISTDPDVLLIDEVLAVGDEAFQARCTDAINDFKNDGRTIVYVSHSLETVKQLCEKSLLLHNSRIETLDYSGKVISDYHKQIDENKETYIKDLEINPHEIPADINPSKAVDTKTVHLTNRWGSHEIDIRSVKLINSKGRDTVLFNPKESIHVNMEYYVNEKVENIVFGISIHSKDGVYINGTNTFIKKINLSNLKNMGTIQLKYSPCLLLPGDYLITVGVCKDNNWNKPIDFHHLKYPFIIAKNQDIIMDEGLVELPTSWEFNDAK